ncbi:MAG: DUF4352 domain-containing protein [Candidatus Saccharimonadaceae bacterium]
MTKHHINTNIERDMAEKSADTRKARNRFHDFRHHNRLLSFVVILAVVAVVVINALFVVSLVMQASSSQVSREYPTVVKSLETINSPVVAARVSDVTTNSTADLAFSIPTDETMLIMKIKITNNTDTTQHLIPVSQFYVRSSEGDHSPLHVSSYVSEPLSSQDLAAGASAEGQISFAIRKTIERPLLYVDTGWNDATPLVIDVLH